MWEGQMKEGYEGRVKGKVRGKEGLGKGRKGRGKAGEGEFGKGRD